MRRILFVYEYGPRPDDTMMADLIVAIRKSYPSLKTQYLHGFLNRYIAGGTHPLRVLNLIYVYAKLPFAMVLFRPQLVFVRTTPPGIQLWAAFLGILLKIRVSTWLMDYHPEIEVRLMQKRGWHPRTYAFLRKCDEFFLKRMDSAVVLDVAMERLVRSRAPNLRVIVHPTWSSTVPDFQPVQTTKKETTGEMRLVYAGNLGASHPLDSFLRVIDALNQRVLVRIYAVGLSPRSEERLSAAAASIGIPVERAARMPFQDLGEYFKTKNIDLGIVLLSDETAGLVSPSKFGAYLAFGVPTLYIGPEGTNADEVCTRFNAGLSLRNNATAAEISTCIARLTTPDEASRIRSNVPRAAEYYRTRSADSLLYLLRPLWFGNSC